MQIKQSAAKPLNMGESSTTNINMNMQNLEDFKGISAAELRGFFTGVILGDGHIAKGVHKRALEIKSINKEFIDLIEAIIKGNTPFNYFIKHIDAIERNGVFHREHWVLTIKAHPYFNKIYNNFYDDKRHRKIYSQTINWLNPIGLACWYMSDGYVCLVGKTKGFIRSRRVDICTDRYKREDILLIMNILKQKFDINTSLIKRDNFYRIRINNDSYETFINIISPYVVPSMRYKLYLGTTINQIIYQRKLGNFKNVY